MRERFENVLKRRDGEKWFDWLLWLQIELLWVRVKHCVRTTVGLVACFCLHFEFPSCCWWWYWRLKLLTSDTVNPISVTLYVFTSLNITPSSLSDSSLFNSCYCILFCSILFASILYEISIIYIHTYTKILMNIKMSTGNRNLLNSQNCFPKDDHYILTHFFTSVFQNTGWRLSISELSLKIVYTKSIL